jgi:hypothetical protein
MSYVPPQIIELENSNPSAKNMEGILSQSREKILLQKQMGTIDRISSNKIDCFSDRVSSEFQEHDFILEHEAQIQIERISAPDLVPKVFRIGSHKQKNLEKELNKDIFNCASSILSDSSSGMQEFYIEKIEYSQELQLEPNNTQNFGPYCLNKGDNSSNVSKKFITIPLEEYSFLCDIAKKYRSMEIEREQDYGLYKDLLNEGYFSKLQYSFTQTLLDSHLSDLLEIKLDSEKILSRLRKDQIMGKILTLDAHKIQCKLEQDLDSYADFKVTKFNKNDHVELRKTAVSTTKPDS